MWIFSNEAEASGTDLLVSKRADEMNVSVDEYLSRIRENIQLEHLESNEDDARVAAEEAEANPALVPADADTIARGKNAMDNWHGYTPKNLTSSALDSILTTDSLNNAITRLHVESYKAFRDVQRAHRHGLISHYSGLKPRIIADSQPQLTIESSLFVKSQFTSFITVNRDTVEDSPHTVDKCEQTHGAEFLFGGQGPKGNLGYGNAAIIDYYNNDCTGRTSVVTWQARVVQAGARHGELAGLDNLIKEYDDKIRFFSSELAEGQSLTKEKEDRIRKPNFLHLVSAILSLD
ncbi:unnamed protein product [Clonostachys byssicola]|uniref:Uncharacterized protein n=1 Tax=Clonostachys byssicola TaxID=160290 RepID=A0A9N9XWJ2_9HYPO|nr:unnamed protein product [Clonostachys byssicola]